jgi:formamidopyrimidine-DNA glycosylase
MPELPEVEVVKRSLKNKILNLVLKSVQINNKKLRYKIDTTKIKKLCGKKINSIKRRSKYLLISFDNKLVLLVHLGMTGKFFIKDNKKNYERLSFYYNSENNHKKHDHVIFNFNNYINLIYNDVRKFGFIKIIKSEKILKNKHLNSLGPEPLSKYFSFKYFKDQIINKNNSIKNVLMDQKFVSGLGNIYVNEILFLSKINPEKNIKKISNNQIRKIVLFTKIILKKSIKLGGSSIKDFKDSSGNRGKFQQKFNVYNKEGTKCPTRNCNNLIKKIYISKRSTFYCYKCQK